MTSDIVALTTDSPGELIIQLEELAIEQKGGKAIVFILIVSLRTD